MFHLDTEARLLPRFSREAHKSFFQFSILIKQRPSSRCKHGGVNAEAEGSPSSTRDSAYARNAADTCQMINGSPYFVGRMKDESDEQKRLTGQIEFAFSMFSYTKGLEICAAGKASAVWRTVISPSPKQAKDESLLKRSTSKNAYFRGFFLRILFLISFSLKDTGTCRRLVVENKSGRLFRKPQKLPTSCKCVFPQGPRMLQKLSCNGEPN